MSDTAAVHEIAASALDEESLASLFTRAYEGYPVAMHVDADAIRFMIHSFDLDRDASRVLLEDGVPVAVAMLGRRGSRGWIGGMGVLAAARRRGHARRVMRAVIERATALGVTALDLEVLVQNREAIPLYESLGFRHTRALDVWRFTPPPTPPGAELAPLPLAEARTAVRRWRKAPEPWQRADGSLDRFLAQGLVFDATVARRNGREVGVVIHRHAGARVSVLQLGVEPGAEGVVVPALLGSLARADAPEGVRWLNLPADDPAAALVRALVPAPEASQHEMRLMLG